MNCENYQPTLDKILQNNAALDTASIKQVLILHEEKLVTIGDWCIRFDRLKYLKSFLENARVTINFTAEGINKLSNALLKNNPHLHTVTARKWQEIAFEKYDFIISISYNEPAILAYLHEKYGSLIQSNQFRVCVYTMSQLMLTPDVAAVPVFPVNQELIGHFEKLKAPAELFITKEEQQWANEWLKEKGMKENEQLFIILDSTTRRDKLLKMQVYFEWLMAILKREDVKVLIFDETSKGKKEFYSEFLGEDLMAKFIFSNSLSLREDICLLGSSYTKLVFGPCTGLMHCASSIYNNYVNNGLDRNQVPVMITYTGKYPPMEKHAYLWWSNAPLVHVLVLRNKNYQKTMLLLDDLNEEEKITNDGLPCSEYTAPMLIDFVNQQLPYKVMQTV